jgi:hypothetical protein
MKLVRLFVGWFMRFSLISWLLWLTVWLVGWLCLVGWLIGWSVGCDWLNY